MLKRLKLRSLLVSVPLAIPVAFLYRLFQSFSRSCMIYLLSCIDPLTISVLDIYMCIEMDNTAV